MGQRRAEQARRLSRRAGLAAALLAGALFGCERPAGGEAELEAQLRELGYVAWVPQRPQDARRRGVLRHDPARAQPGRNLYVSHRAPRAELLDMQGEVLTSWHAEGSGWHEAALAAGGRLAVLSADRGVQLLGADSELHWQRPLDAHHALGFAAGGRIVTLEAVVREVHFGEVSLPIVANDVVTLSAAGEEVSRVPLHPLFAGRVDADALPRPRGLRRLPLLRRERDVADPYHANSLEILPRDAPGLGRAGDALVSLRELDLVAVVRLGQEPRVVWSFGPGVLEGQHDARLLPNGNVSIFDNGVRRGWSRALEVTPAGEIVWQYSGDPPESLFSRRQGACQHLANGNVLVTESERGRAVEVTREGEVVWEFLNPHTDAKRNARGAIQRMTRTAAAP